MLRGILAYTRTLGGLMLRTSCTSLRVSLRAYVVKRATLAKCHELGLLAGLAVLLMHARIS